MTDELVFDPFDASQTQNMWDLMRKFRDRAPVARMSNGFVYVSRYDDARACLKNANVFSNAGGMRPTGLEIPLHDASIGELVAPIHPPVRRLAFNAAQGGHIVERLRPHARAVSEDLVDRIEAEGSGDLIAGLSLPLTNRVIGALLGVDSESCDRLAAWGEEIMLSPLTVVNETERGVGYEGAFPEFSDFLDSLTKSRWSRVEQSSGDADAEQDTIARIIRSGLEIAPLDTRMVRMILLNLVLGGTATTRDFLGNVLHVLLDDPELYGRVRSDRSLVPIALEESLRHDPPVLYLIRTCAENCEISGVAVEAGERIIVGLASANRDERVYEAPDEFRLDRVDPAMHLSFGYGPHFCVGAALARMEAQEALNAILDRFDTGDLSFAEGWKAELMPLPYMLGPLSLPVVVAGPH